MSGETPRRASLLELAPQWIIAIATLVAALAGAGFFAGRITAQQPTNPAAGSAATAVASSPVTPDNTSTSAPGPTTSPLASTNGTEVAKYPVTIVMDYSVRLGDTAPAQADFVKDKGTDTDLLFSHGFGLGPEFRPVSAANKLYGLANNVAPTYNGCKTTTLFVTSVPVVKGNTFCISKPGRMIGVTAMGTATKAGQAVGISVVVWMDQPS